MIASVLIGNVLDILPTLPAASINCVVTSPPYWNLRDYGTATWTSGDAECNHRVGRFTRGGLSGKQASNSGSVVLPWRMSLARSLPLSSGGET